MFAHQPYVLARTVLALAILAMELEATRPDPFQYGAKKPDVNEVRRYCGAALSSALQTLCDGVYNSRFKKSNRETETKDEYTFGYEVHPFRSLESVWKMLRFRRGSWGVHEECCLQPCSREEMRSYCGYISDSPSH